MNNKSFRIYTLAALIALCAIPSAAAAAGTCRLIPMDKVRLLESRFRDNFERDSAWVMSIATDRLLHSFRTTAGIWSGNEGGYMAVPKLGGWESLDCELRGHTTGHILTALAYMYVSTGQECFRIKADSLLAGLHQVQNAFGNGYLSAFPEELINRNIRGEKVWAPWYTLHKITAGLLDQYQFCGSQEALLIMKGMASWAWSRLNGLDEGSRETMLKTEFGGIGESWWRLYEITRDDKDLFLARFFTQKSVTDPLKQSIADFGTKHTNTYIPKVLALSKEYGITGDESARQAVLFFWNEMVSRHAFCTGSLSDREHFFAPEEMSEHITGYTGETCCTYNMLNLTARLYEWTGDEAAVDYYERALVNHILGQQNPDDGMVSYFLPLKTGTHKVYSTPEKSFWCCVGSGFESHASYGRFIYAESGDTLIVNLFIPSEVEWNGLKVRMTGGYPYDGKVHLSISCDRSVRRTIMVRQPRWSGKEGYKAYTRRWRDGDTIDLSFDMGIRLEHPEGDSSLTAVLKGPAVMARRLGTGGFVFPEPQSNPSSYNDYYTYDYHIPDGLPSAIDTSALAGEVARLSPLFDIHSERYAVYFKTADGHHQEHPGEISIPQMPSSYPRMTEAVLPDESRQEKVNAWAERPQELAGRLQMYWDTHATEIFIAGEVIDRAGGPAAPVPTVRYSSSRSNLSNYRRPPLEEIPIRQDTSGLWMINRTTGKGEFADPSRTARNVESINLEILKTARDAAAMYACGAGEKYARLAEAVFDTYVTGLYYRQAPIDILHTHQQTLVGLTSFEVIHEDAVDPVTECYDLLHDYLAARYPEKIVLYEDTFRRWADVIIAGGVPHNNWDLIQARFILKLALVLQDDSSYADGRGRSWYLNEIFNENSIRQWSIGKLIDYGFDSETGLWKECPNYSTMVLQEFSSLITTVKKTTGLDLPAIYPILTNAVRVLPQYCFPNGWIPAWGDGFYGPLRQGYFLDLGENQEQYRTPVFYSRDVSWFAARSGSDADSSLMFSVVGSNGNHMHANGISLELYGRGYVLAPDMGKGAGYETSDHNEYYSQFPAHNTVCVDGVSTYATMQSHHPYTLNSCYPSTDHKEYDSPVMFGDFSFIEPETQSDQRRQVIAVTAPEGGYYIDIFRSRRRDGQDSFHDYFFHGMGQELSLNLQMAPTEELSFAGAHLYGYSYLWDKYVADGCGDFTGRFIMTGMDGVHTGLKLWFNGADRRRVFRASAPVANSLTRCEVPYDVASTPVPTMVVRQEGEAWNHPFIAVYEPFRDGDATVIESVEFSGGASCRITVTLSGGRQDIISTSPDGKLLIESAGKSYSNCR